MILSDVDLRILREQKCFPETCYIGPSSVDLTLSPSYAKLTSVVRIINPENELVYDKFTSDRYKMNPHEFILASTNEYIRVPEDMAAYVEGRSSIGRLGLQVQNAGFIDPGFEGQITLELKNQSGMELILYEGLRICQLVYVKLSSKVDTPYQGKYNKQLGATESRIIQDIL